VILDVIYQMKVHGSVFAGQLLFVAFVLAIVPYLVLRGPVNRIVRTVIARNHKDVAIAKAADVGPRHG
jgi:hypothetical protein